MQKKLIALAVAGLVSGGAFAQTNVTISGLARMSFEQYKLGNTGAASYSAENRVSDQSSMLVFSGKEDMGGGNYASFQIDNRYSPDLGAISASGNTNIGLGGNWGVVKLGRQDLHYGAAIEGYKAYTLQNLLHAGLFSQVNGQSIANATRTPNVIWYDSPNMSGFNGRAAYSTNWAANEGSGLNDGSRNGAWNLALNYANGPILAGYSYWKAKAEGGAGATAATSDQRGDTLQFGWTGSMGWKAGLAWNKSSLTNGAGVETSRTAWLLPVSYTFGANQLALTYARAGNLSTTTTSGANAWTLAWGNSLSKRTNVGIAYTRQHNDANAKYNLFAIGANGATAAINGASISQFSFNVNHGF